MSTTTSHKRGRHGLSEAWLYSFSTHHMVYGILFTTLLSVRLGPGFKPLLRRSRMSFPAGPLASFCCVISLALVSLLPCCLQRSGPGSNPRLAQAGFRSVISSSLLNKLLAAISQRFESPSRQAGFRSVISSSPCFVMTFSGHLGSNLRPLRRSVLVAASFHLQ